MLFEYKIKNDKMTKKLVIISYFVANFRPKFIL